MQHRLSLAKILVVDDSEISRRIIVSGLVKAGFNHIETAKDGTDALKKTYRLVPDLVILDLHMPNLDGFAYCEQVRADVELPRMPIIVETVSDQREAKLRALSCGVDDFLQKPMDMEELGLRVSIHLERFFMMQDIQNMCLYLKMEFSEMQRVIQRVEQTNAAPQILESLQRHCEVLETMTALPSH